MYTIDTTARIYTYQLPRLQAVVDQLNRKAARLGAGGYTLTSGEPYQIEQTVRSEISIARDGRKIIASVVDITISGEYPTHDGWSLAAVNEHDADTGLNILRTLPWFSDTTAALPVEYRDSSNTRCDECGRAIARVNTYVVTNGADFRQVGSTCLKSFLGSGSVARLVGLSTALDTVFEMLASFGSDDYDPLAARSSGHELMDTSDVLAVTMAAIRTYGWTSRKQSRDSWDTTATADRVQSYLSPFTKAKDRDPALAPTEADIAKAEAVGSWLADLMDTLDPDASSDYLWNLAVLGSKMGVTSRHLGLLCSAHVAYANELNRQAEAASVAARANEYVGDVLDKVDLLVEIVQTSAPIENTFAWNAPPNYWNTMRTPEGNTVKWFTARDLECEYGRGTLVRIKGSIKKLALWKDEKQTILTRCKVTEVS